MFIDKYIKKYLKYKERFDIMLSNLLYEQKGQALILVALILPILLGFAALVVDVGNLYLTKAQLQKTADAAAFAGAQDLPTTSTAMSTAITYADQNGMKATVNGVKESGDTVTATSPYNGDSTKIAVQCTRTVQNYFAGILGPDFATTVVSASAVATSRWNGNTLPFLNIAPYTTAGSRPIWTKQLAGYFESIDTSEYSPGPVNYLDGVSIANGVKNDKDIQTLLDLLWSEEQNETVYVLSVSASCIANNLVHFTDGTSGTLDKINQEGSNKTIVPSDIVLLECTWTGYDGNKGLTLTYSGNSYDVENGVIPTGRPNLGGSKLLQ